MKKLLGTTALLSMIVISPAMADPAIMVGIAFDFGRHSFSEGLGVTVKALSSDRPEHFVAGGGVTLFPFAKDKFGLDVSAGYTFNQGAVLAGYDVLNLSPQLSAGWADTKKKVIFISDWRLKRDINLLATLESGIKIYSFRYNWSDTTYVGVMAQDLLAHPQWCKAVIRNSSGFYAVDYVALGLRMATLDAWNQDGLAAILLADYRLESFELAVA